MLSKTQQKQKMHQLQDIGVRLIALKPALLAKLALDPHLQESVLAAKKMARSALARQEQYLGRLIRELPEIKLQQLLQSLQSLNSNDGNQLITSKVNKYRTLLYQGELSLPELQKMYPEADLGKVQILISQLKDHNLSDKDYKEAWHNLYLELQQLIQNANCSPGTSVQ